MKRRLWLEPKRQILRCAQKGVCEICGSRKIQTREFAVVLFGGFVVSFGGGELILEIPDGGSLAIRADFGDPAFFPAVPGDAFVSGGAGLSDSSGVAIVLGASGRADIGLSVVQAVMIDVVGHHAGRDLHYLAVHINGDTMCSSAERGVTLGVKGVAVLGNVPFVLI